MKILGVHFAPISVPKERRLQTLAVVIWCCIFFWTVPMTILILYNLLFHSNYLWPFALIYIAWYFYDLDVCNKGGRRYIQFSIIIKSRNIQTLKKLGGGLIFLFLQKGMVQKCYTMEILC